MGLTTTLAAAGGGKGKTMDELLRFFEGVGVNRWNFAVLELRKSGDGACMKGDARCRDRAEVERSLAWARARNAAGHDVYLRPARYGENGEPMGWPVVFMDDLTPDLALRIANKYLAAVVESSEGNCQVWLACDRVLTEAERKAVQSDLVNRIGADGGSKSGEHFGRAPGFRNKKKIRRNDLVRVLATSEGKPFFHPLTPDALPPAAASVVADGSGRSERGSAGNSEQEFKFACIALSHGDDPSDVTRRVAEHAFSRGKRRTMAGCEDYARRTVENAQGALK